MPRKTTVYIDIDDTIIAQTLPGSGFDLRPCAMTHLTVLSRMYDCCWLTMWPRKTTVYIDIDDTIIAQTLPGSGFDLRPCAMTHLTVLSRMYDCCWLTM